MSRIDLVSKNLLEKFFSQLSQKKSKLRKNYVKKSLSNVAKIARITKCNKIQDLEREKAKTGPEKVRKCRKNLKSDKDFSC